MLSASPAHCRHAHGDHLLRVVDDKEEALADAAHTPSGPCWCPPLPSRTEELLGRKDRNPQVYFIFAWAGLMMKFCKNLAGLCGAPTYLPTYLPYLWETKKEIMGRVKVGYYTN